jgi:hypothetical protein
MSFLIIAGFLVWKAAHAANGTRAALYLIGAAASASLGVAGMRERHRRH